jgi:hypothetical protein
MILSAREPRQDAVEVAEPSWMVMTNACVVRLVSVGGDSG